MHCKLILLLLLYFQNNFHLPISLDANKSHFSRRQMFWSIKVDDNASLIVCDGRWAMGVSLVG